MKYMGSKARHAKQLLPIILKNRKLGQWYVEPFVGGANMIDKVDGNRIGADINHYLISLLKAVQDGFIPPENISELQYLECRDYKDDFEPEIVGFVGIGCSYSGKWFGGFARGNNSKGEPRNYAKESRDNLLKQVPGLEGIEFVNCDYKELGIPEKSIIYCDPPYIATTRYKDSIDYNEFWQWCNDRVEQGHTVFVSEYQAPDDWTCVWEKEVNSSLTKDTGAKKAVEKLFTKEQN